MNLHSRAAAWVVLGEGLALVQWAGAALVMAAAVLAALWETRTQPPIAD